MMDRGRGRRGRRAATLRLAGLLLPFFVVLSAGCAFRAVPPPEPTLRGRLADAADSLLVQPLEASGATVGVLVLDPGGGTLYAHDAGRLMLPASVQKLALAAAARLALGPGFRWETRIVGTGRLDSAGVLSGDLVLVGSWDPSLSGDEPYTDHPWRVFRALADSLRALGLRRVEGNIVAVGGRFTPGGWEAGDLE
ncbi:MAG TPA: hypothetical protein ENI92_01115, partial [Bacteroidetes bacterium]|nr:hypothetical protein [Bacteroidota bacterium]